MPTAIGQEDVRNYTNAILNILDDAHDERARLDDFQKAILNVLDDSNDERARYDDFQKAILNLLEDFDIEKIKIGKTNREMAREIVEREQAEVAMREAKAIADAANRELEAFSYSVAHDLRAPVRAIDGFSQMLEEDCGSRLNDEGRRVLKVIRDNTHKMGTLIDDLLDYSRLGRQDISRARVDMEALAKEVLSELLGQAAGRALSTSVGPLPPTRGDRTMLRQVWTNLLGNALKFSQGRDPARISVEGHLSNGEAVYIVRDNGAGFDMKYVHKLFGVFQRLHRQDEFEGTGVGLAIVSRVVGRHGGRVRAEGRLGEGSFFEFILPGQDASTQGGAP